MQYFVSMLWILYSGLTIVLIGIVILAVWMFKEYFALKGHSDPYEDLIGELGTVKQECTPLKKGKVYVKGAYWDAVCEFGSLNVGEDIKVTGLKEKLLIIVKVDLLSE